jgi:hypothetical protein
LAVSLAQFRQLLFGSGVVGKEFVNRFGHHLHVLFAIFSQYTVGRAFPDNLPLRPVVKIDGKRALAIFKI